MSSVAAQEQHARDAARKRVARSVTAQVAAQQKRTVQGAVFPVTRSKEDDAS